MDSIRFLLERGSRVTDQTLEVAAIVQNPEVLRLVVQQAHVNLAGERGAVMLAQAARGPKTDSVEVLLKSGADLNFRGKPGRSTPLVAAIGSGSLPIARLFLERGAKVDIPDERGRTELWTAAASRNTGFIAMLVEHGANVNARDNQGQTALMSAAGGCYTWAVRALLDAGADPGIKDNKGKTARDLPVNLAQDPKCGTARALLDRAVRLKQ